MDMVERLRQENIELREKLTRAEMKIREYKSGKINLHGHLIPDMTAYNEKIKRLNALIRQFTDEWKRESGNLSSVIDRVQHIRSKG
jgi:hypothetical protein